MELESQWLLTSSFEFHRGFYFEGCFDIYVQYIQYIHITSSFSV